MTIAALATVSAAFECDGRALPGAYLNDDYCDCADGSDEAATGACADTIYVCRNLPHKPKQIFSSRVNDGVCDCCDGSDEANSTDCPNGCIALATEAFGALSRGCLRRAELAIAAAKAASSDAERLSAARAQLATATPTIDALHDAKAAAEADEASKRDGRAARLAAGEVETSLGVERLDAGMTLRALVRVALWGGVEGVDRMYDLLVERPGLEEAAEEVAMKARDEAAAEKGQSAGGGGGGGVCDAAGACGHAREHEAALLQLLEPLPEDGGALRAVLRVLHAELGAGATSALAQAARELLAETESPLDDAAVAAALELLEPFRHDEAEAARAAHKAAVEAVQEASEAERQLAPKEAIAASGGYGAGLEWRQLHGRCFEAEDRGFTYKACPFQEMRQGSPGGRASRQQTLLGNFTRWEPVSGERASQLARAGRTPSELGTMRFEGGAACGGGAVRRATLYFECGEQDALLEVTEPETCVYEAWMSTPLACSLALLREKVATLEEASAAASLEFRPSDELRALLAAPE
ncbi:hypothetical protein EMIHUDRAFT_463291 [Emiliania huxleyi CCMP1516]|uniref:Glucosidase 2 subunit beta n=2 Tax=Emiliania huxleyi TaxID=2903 RepID=A0A0D3JUP7_EMIH1|nr:hypothetical protein EMIHUDRAFT_463291 [Emiliania huxleyi CCMP1516]EOD27232.1 hypothetical protein EMIHUDRAFT_463291 [Emiliania huxleyi CCMP1516]|eukprot:XP_005779661.1 hypothetical protein EMIHUDRAFT_463291 [Emiliania huxleyi CCMP1516]